MENATKIATWRGQGEGIVVLKCRVNLQNCKDMGTANDPNITVSPEPNYNSLTGMHPPSAGIAHPWQEWVLKDPSRLRISEVHMIGGIVNGDVNLPRANIYVKGTCTFNGSITCGNLVFG